MCEMVLADQVAMAKAEVVRKGLKLEQEPSALLISGYNVESVDECSLLNINTRELVSCRQDYLPWLSWRGRMVHKRRT